MKGFFGATDNEEFVFLSQQPEIGEVNFSPKQSAIITAGKGLDIHGDHSFTKTCDKRVIPQAWGKL